MSVQVNVRALAALRVEEKTLCNRLQEVRRQIADRAAHVVNETVVGYVACIMTSSDGQTARYTIPVSAHEPSHQSNGLYFRACSVREVLVFQLGEGGTEEECARLRPDDVCALGDSHEGRAAAERCLLRFFPGRQSKQDAEQWVALVSQEPAGHAEGGT